MAAPPIPPDCPYFTSSGQFAPPGAFKFEDAEHEKDWAEIVASVAFTYWTKEAQRLNASLAFADDDDLLKIEALHQDAVGNGIAWAKWGGL